MQNNPKQFKKFKKGPLLVAITLLVLSLAAFVWTYKAVKSTEAESHKIEGEWQAEADRREAIRSLERSIREVEEEREELETHFAESENIVPFLDTLEGMARLAGGEAKVVSVDIPADKNELVVSLQVEGSFASNYKFVKLLEHSPYELEIESMDLTRSESSGAWGGRFTLRLLSFVK